MRRKLRVKKHSIFISMFSITVLLTIANGVSASSKADDTFTYESASTQELNRTYNVLDDNEVISELLRDDWTRVQFLFGNKEVELTDQKEIDEFFDFFYSNLNIRIEEEKNEKEFIYATPFSMIIKTNSGKRYNIVISGSNLIVNDKCYLLEDDGKLCVKISSYF